MSKECKEELVSIIIPVYNTGRILVRESGTEPVVRVMVEAPDHDTCQKYVSEVVDVIRDRGWALSECLSGRLFRTENGNCRVRFPD